MILSSLASMAFGLGTTLVLSTLPWFAMQSRSTLLAPHLGAGDRALPGSAQPVENRTFVIIGAMVGRLGEQASGALEPLARRLERVHHPETVGAFRFRQGALWLCTTLLGAAIAAAATPGALGTLLLLGVVPTVVALGPEIELHRRSRRWSAQTEQQLPVVGEHLVALLQGGSSATSALDRIADDAGGPVQRDLARLVAHHRRGGDLHEGLAQWADLADVPGVLRLTRVLALHHRTPDLADLVAGEVGAMREELHRELLARIDRRGQQVWIPVTVAALVPGAIFLLVPFFDALRAFGATG